jgi:hypothetical protein
VRSRGRLLMRARARAPPRSRRRVRTAPRAPMQRRSRRRRAAPRVVPSPMRM